MNPPRHSMNLRRLRKALQATEHGTNDIRHPVNECSKPNLCRRPRPLDLHQVSNELGRECPVMDRYRIPSRVVLFYLSAQQIVQKLTRGCRAVVRLPSPSVDLAGLSTIIVRVRAQDCQTHVIRLLRDSLAQGAIDHRLQVSQEGAISICVPRARTALASRFLPFLPLAQHVG